MRTGLRASASLLGGWSQVLGSLTVGLGAPGFGVGLQLAGASAQGVLGLVPTYFMVRLCPGARAGPVACSARSIGWL